jgi:hypothetical protein
MALRGLASLLENPDRWLGLQIPLASIYIFYILLFVDPKSP